MWTLKLTTKVLILVLITHLFAYDSGLGITRIVIVQDSNCIPIYGSSPENIDFYLISIAYMMVKFVLN
jgi:hypothetical protein